MKIIFLPAEVQDTPLFIRSEEGELAELFFVFNEQQLADLGSNPILREDIECVGCQDPRVKEADHEPAN
ncbi:MAG: hypothetical protein ABSA33_03245 [Candidatus Micrarchaeaceae archaeon]